MTAAAQQAGGVPTKNHAVRIVKPLPEPERPRLDRCLTNQQAWLAPWNSPHRRSLGLVHIVRESNPQQAYLFNPLRRRISLKHHGEGWGRVCFGIVHPRLEEGVYQIPNRDNCEHVAIKCLNKQVVDAALRAGTNENPYKEIYRMQTLGDNVHVLGCIEALQDQTYIYI